MENMENLENISKQIYDLIVVYGPKLIGAIITLIVGMWVISIIRSALRKRFEKETSIRRCADSSTA